MWQLAIWAKVLNLPEHLMQILVTFENGRIFISQNLSDAIFLWMFFGYVYWDAGILGAANWILECFMDLQKMNKI